MEKLESSDNSASTIKKLNDAMEAVGKLLKADADGNDSLTWYEFLAFMEQSSQVKDPSQALQLQKIFDKNDLNQYNDKLKQYRIWFLRADDDNNGILDKDEVANMLRIVNNPLLASSVDKYMNKFDENKDNKISWHEFLTSMDSIQPMITINNHQNNKIYNFFVQKYPKLQYKPESVLIKFNMVKEYFQKIEHITSKDIITLSATKIYKSCNYSDLTAKVPYKKIYHALIKYDNYHNSIINKQKYNDDINRLLAKFKAADVNNDGVINRDELVTLLQNNNDKYAVEAAIHAATRLMGKIDQDGNGTITWQEFQDFMQQKANMSRKKKNHLIWNSKQINKINK